MKFFAMSLIFLRYAQIETENILHIIASIFLQRIIFSNLFVPFLTSMYISIQIKILYYR